jgi:hypothetical protein
MTFAISLAFPPGNCACKKEKHKREIIRSTFFFIAALNLGDFIQIKAIIYGVAEAIDNCHS